MQIRIGETVLTVDSLYPYIYNFGEGKEVLRIRVLRENHGYAEIEAALENPSADLEQVEDGVVVNVYKNYTEDFKCSYANGAYEVELTRKGELSERVDELDAEVLSLKQVNANLMLQVAQMGGLLNG